MRRQRAWREPGGSLPDPDYSARREGIGMCGIAGKINFAGDVDPSVLVRMCDAMTHRGPDSRGIHVDRGVGLAMQRLAIIDVEGGDQPIFNEDRSVAVVMNGEIYNFQELRAELIERGHRFTSRVDTEVLVHLYEEVGEKLVERLRGMFAFAIWDARQRRLVLGRDRVGKKPLFWSRRGDTVWFASEIMTLIQDPEIERRPNPRAIASYLTLQYVPDPLSAFENVHKLRPATTLCIDAGGESARRYWSLDYADTVGDATPEELQERLRELLWDATKIRMISEVPLGAFLSGGVDSSAIVAAIADQSPEPVKTFSIGFSDAAFDESDYARTVARQFATDHHEYVVEPDAIAIMPKLARHYGEPFADPSAIPSFYLAEMTGRHVTVALNGDGGDESFAGYNRYKTSPTLAQLSRLPRSLRRQLPALLRSLGHGPRHLSARSRVQRLSTTLSLEAGPRYAHGMALFPRALRDETFQPDFVESLGGWDPDAYITRLWTASTAPDRIDRMLDVDVQTYLPGDLLVKMDIATMAYSVEARSPFLDHHLMEFAASIPGEQKMQGTSAKLLLKAALRGVIPDDIIDRPKMGFQVPLRRWFQEELRELPYDVLLDPGARIAAYVRRDATRRMIDEHHSGVVDHSHRLWGLLQLEYWHREVVESPIAATVAR